MSHGSSTHGSSTRGSSTHTWPVDKLPEASGVRPQQPAPKPHLDSLHQCTAVECLRAGVRSQSVCYSRRPQQKVPLPSQGASRKNPVGAGHDPGLLVSPDFRRSSYWRYLLNLGDLDSTMVREEPRIFPAAGGGVGVSPLSVRNPNMNYSAMVYLTVKQ